GMVARDASFGYQRGFGGHFHNDNSIAALRDIPGLIVAVPSHPSTADGLLRTCVRLADAGHVVVFCEPIALYHRRDLASDGDREWLTMQPVSDRSSTRTSPGALTPASESGAVTMWTHGADLAIVTYGNGVPMSVDAARRLL